MWLLLSAWTAHAAPCDPASVQELVDAIAVGSPAHRGELASMVLGSTSHRAIHLAPCDVLVVKPKPAAD